ncbi:Aste57867_4357 [Aphanomyces stellatus]|uniref:Aste57867_4357 protein n=1 Tax=Aphanomyces stellatus TaxID=120398 RepID=A0A485KBA8_9STRA|nr:hypothetical protein As57867_004345 [Aphanomyces stellatus]VFT81471.1 Aste57867_4357 [Aphanomyces stellatus]
MMHARRDAGIPVKDDAPSDIKAGHDDDLNEWILKANPTPVKETSLRAVVRKLEQKKFYDRQFALTQAQTKMNRYTLRFSGAYEAAYAASTETDSIVLVRVVFLYGFLLRAGFLAYSYSFASTHARPVTLVLDFGVSLPAFVLGFALTFVPRRRQSSLSLEALTAIVFAIVAASLIAKKPLERAQGPVLELMLLLIPIFGISRMRFVTSVVLGCAIVLVYLGVQLGAAVYVPGCDTPKEVLYQTFNYSIRVFGGIVSHYRQELLRRRNFALQLPFTGLVGGDTYMPQRPAVLSTPLMHPYRLHFRDLRVEAAFYQFWYLIDPFPFENIYNPLLHNGVVRVVRGALISVCLSQGLLAFQDMKLLEMYPSVQVAAYLARFAVVLPAYLVMVATIYCLSRRFVRHATSLDAMHDSSYVGAAQSVAAVVVTLHMAAMATLVLVVYTADATLSDLYFMGFLNALLFVHRSGFRVRFVVAGCTTAVSVVGFVVAAACVLPRAVSIEYAMYTVAVLLLGSLTSHEEEALRRSFFVLKSIRTLQFLDWFDQVLTVQSWMRTKLHTRLAAIRGTADDETSHVGVTAQMDKASNVDLMGQVVEAIASIV